MLNKPCKPSNLTVLSKKVVQLKCSCVLWKVRTYCDCVTVQLRGCFQSKAYQDVILKRRSVYFIFVEPTFRHPLSSDTSSVSARNCCTQQCVHREWLFNDKNSKNKVVVLFLRHIFPVKLKLESDGLIL